MARLEYNKFLIFSLFVIFFFTLVLQQDALAAVTISWVSTVPPGVSSGLSTNDGGVNSNNDPLYFTVSDPSLASNGLQDTISVKVNSTSNPSGIVLTLHEHPGDGGIFTNTGLILTRYQFHQSDKIVVTLNSTGANVNPNAIEYVPNPLSLGGCCVTGLSVYSTSDTTGIPFYVKETGPNTGLFSNTLNFSSSVSIANSTIKAVPGDIVSIFNHDTGEFQNWLIIPNPNGALGAINAKFDDDLTAVYGGVKSTVLIDASSGSGGGGGGLVQPSLVLDIIAAIGGSPYIVQPPSFGGHAYGFSDGLTLTQSNNKSIFDISKYNQEIPKQVMIAGTKVNMTFKTFESYYSQGVIHMGLYIIPRGQDMITTNSIAHMELDKGKPVKVHDPNHLLSNVAASFSSDGIFQYTTFSFTPTKSYDKMSFLVRAWNDHMYTIDTRLHDGLDVSKSPKSLPAGVFRYDSFADLQSALYKDQFYKPRIMGHIHDTNAVFPNSQGKVYWLYDTIGHFVTLVISDQNDNELFSYKSSLQPYEIEKKGDYKFMYFTVKQLNRWDVDQIQKAMKTEEEKALKTEITMKIMRPSNW